LRRGRIPPHSGILRGRWNADAFLLKMAGHTVFGDVWEVL